MSPAVTVSAPVSDELGVFDVIDLLTGYQQAALLTAASRLGVFDLLGAGPASSEQVASRLACEPLAVRALLDSLAELRLLRTVDSGYAVTPAGRRLASDGDLRLVAEKEAFFARVWLDLADSVRTGEPRIDPWRQRLADDPEQCLNFLRALVVLATETGIDATRLPGVRPGARVLDVGGGLGAYAVPLAEAGCEVTLVDLPEVCAWVSSELSARGVAPEVQSRVRVLPVDLFAEGAAEALAVDGGYDLVLVSHLLHDLNDDDCAVVLSLVAGLVAAGGHLAVFELPGQGPGAFGPMFDLMMRVETAGRARRLDELVSLVAAAGLSEVRVDERFALPHGVVVGTRAG